MFADWTEMKAMNVINSKYNINFETIGSRRCTLIFMAFTVPGKELFQWVVIPYCAVLGHIQ